MRTEQGHMNALQMLIETTTGQRVSMQDIIHEVDVMDFFGQSIAEGEEKDLRWAPHIWGQATQLGDLLESWKPDYESTTRDS